MELTFGDFGHTRGSWHFADGFPQSVRASDATEFGVLGFQIIEPDVDAGHGIHYTTFRSIRETDVDLRMNLYSKVVSSGGTTRCTLDTIPDSVKQHGLVRHNRPRVLEHIHWRLRANLIWS